VAGGEFEEAAIIIIERQGRADSGGQETGGKFVNSGFGVIGTEGSNELASAE
jgi:hypothetical protein